jgi:hypothetical protein
MAPPLGAAVAEATARARPGAGAAAGRGRVAVAAACRSSWLPAQRALRPCHRGALLRVRAADDANKERVRERVNRIEEEINRQARPRGQRRTPGSKPTHAPPTQHGVSVTALFERDVSRARAALRRRQRTAGRRHAARTAPHAAGLPPRVALRRAPRRS